MGVQAKWPATSAGPRQQSMRPRSAAQARAGLQQPGPQEASIPAGCGPLEAARLQERSEACTVCGPPATLQHAWILPINVNPGAGKGNGAFRVF